MKISKYIWKKLVLMIVAQLVSLGLLAAFLVYIKASMLYADRQTQATQIVGQFRELALEADATAQMLSETYDEMCRSKAKALAWLVENAAVKAGIDVNGLTEEQTEALSENRLGDVDGLLAELQILLGVDNVLLATREGVILGSAWETGIDLSVARYNQLRTTFTLREPSEPFTVRLEEGSYRCSAMRVNDHYMAVVLQNPTEQEQMVEDARNWEKLAGSIGTDQDTVCFAVSGRDCTCLYHPDPALIGTDCIGMGLNVGYMEDGAFTVMDLWGTSMYCAFAEINGDFLVCAIPRNPLTPSELLPLVLVLAFFYVLTCTVMVYGVFVMMDAEKGGDELQNRFRPVKLFKRMCMDRVMAAKIPIAIFIGLVGMFVISFYAQTLLTFSEYSLEYSNELHSLQEQIENNRVDSTVIGNRLDYNRLAECKTAAYVIQKYPEKANNRGMAEISGVLDVEATYLLDSGGRLIANDAGQGNFSLSDDPEKQSYPFNKLLQGADYVIQEPMIAEISGKYQQHIGCCLRDSDGNITGAVQIAIDPSVRERVTNRLSMETALRDVRIGTEGFAFAVRKSDGTFVMPGNTLSGEKAANYGFGEAQLAGGFNGIISLEGRQYYASSEESGDYLLYMAIPNSELERYRLLFSALTTIFCMICMGLFLPILVVVSRADVQQIVEDAARQDASFGREMPDGSVRHSVPASLRWGQNLLVDIKTPEQRTMMIIKGVVTVIVTIIGILLLLGGRQAGGNSVMQYVLSGRWQRSLNIFALTAALMVVCEIEVGRMLVAGILRLASQAASARGETICRLLSSLLQYAAAIATAYFCLAFVGVDIQTLVASAGILSLVIGLGAQKLIADVIAGLFIIFEGDLQVGDIVTINDYRGTVLEIGLRTTKVMGINDNVRVFTNSSVNDMMNMTRRWSSASVTIAVDYDEDLERVEKIFRDAFPEIRKRIPQVKSDLWLTSITSFAEDGMEMQVRVKCKENDTYRVAAALRREIKLLMDRNGIRFGIAMQRIIQSPDDSLPGGTFEAAGTSEAAGAGEPAPV